MNYMEQVAQMLGVELDEEFYIKGIDYKRKLTKDGLFSYYKEDQTWHKSRIVLCDILTGELEIIKKPILDEVEKEYLSNVIKPFRDSVISICKHNLRGYEYVCTIFYDKFYCNKNCFSLPLFEKGTMYKGMEIDKHYSLKDLGL